MTNTEQQTSYIRFARDIRYALLDRDINADVVVDEWHGYEDDGDETWNQPVYITTEYRDALSVDELADMPTLNDATLDLASPTATWSEQVTFAVDQILNG